MLELNLEPVLEQGNRTLGEWLMAVADAAAKCRAAADVLDAMTESIEDAIVGQAG